MDTWNYCTCVTSPDTILPYYIQSIRKAWVSEMKEPQKKRSCSPAKQNSTSSLISETSKDRWLWYLHVTVIPQFLSQRKHFTPVFRASPPADQSTSFCSVRPTDLDCRALEREEETQCVPSSLSVFSPTHVHQFSSSPLFRLDLEASECLANVCKATQLKYTMIFQFRPTRPPNLDIFHSAKMHPVSFLFTSLPIQPLCPNQIAKNQVMVFIHTTFKNLTNFTGTATMENSMEVP